MRVTKLERAEHGEWEANVTLGGDTRHVSREHGSWQALVGGTQRDIHPDIARELQDRVRREERRERRGDA